MKFTHQQHQVWSTLFDRQLELLKKHGSTMFWEGFKNINFPKRSIPTISELNKQITPKTGWKTKRISIRYSTADQWYPLFAQKIFPVTNFVRSMEELDFTPEPDVFHDTFGHLAFFTMPQYTQFAEMFAPAYLRAKTTEEKENIKRLAWFSYEFGVLIEDGKPKAFGAGLISSFAELNKVVSGEMKLIPFTVENVLQKDKAIWNLHDSLFFFHSLKEIQAQIQTYLQQIK